MRTLLLLRHAKSSWKDADLADHDRPLAARGKRDAPRMGGLIREQDLVPDAIVSSTAKRARKTVEKVIANCGYEGDVVLDELLYHGEPATVIGVLRRLPPTCRSAMIVGHNPGLEDLLETLTGSFETLPTAALARVDLAIDDWSELRASTGELVELWRPRELAENEAS